MSRGARAGAWIARGALALGLALSVATVAAFGGAWHWALEVLSWFRLQFAAGLVLWGLVLWGLATCGLATGAGGSRARAAWLLPALLLNAATLLPFWLPPAASPPDHGVPRLHLLALNVNAHHREPVRIGALLAESDADAILLSEIRPRTLAAIRTALGARYPFVHDASAEGHFGIALLSRLPLLDARTHRLGGARHPSIEAGVRWQGVRVTLFGAHPHPPVGSREARLRDEELAAIGRLLAGVDAPLVVFGDLNAAPWSPPLRALGEKLALRHGALGHGLRPTWRPATHTLQGISEGALGRRLGTLLGAPIDHLLVSDEWTVVDYRLGPGVGSDHAPLTATLVLNGGGEGSGDRGAGALTEHPPPRPEGHAPRGVKSDSGPPATAPATGMATGRQAASAATVSSSSEAASSSGTPRTSASSDASRDLAVRRVWRSVVGRPFSKSRRASTPMRRARS